MFSQATTGIRVESFPVKASGCVVQLWLETPATSVLVKVPESNVASLVWPLPADGIPQGSIHSCQSCCSACRYFLSLNTVWKPQICITHLHLQEHNKSVFKVHQTEVWGFVFYLFEQLHEGSTVKISRSHPPLSVPAWSNFAVWILSWFYVSVLRAAVFNASLTAGESDDELSSSLSQRQTGRDETRLRPLRQNPARFAYWWARRSIYLCLLQINKNCVSSGAEPHQCTVITSTGTDWPEIIGG